MKKRLLWKQITALVLTFFLFLQGCAGHETPGSVENSEKTETETAETQRFDACMDELFRTEVVKNTINLHYILAYPENYGITDYEVSLGDFSLEKIEETYTELEALKKKLLQFDREKLSKSQKLTYDSLMDHVDTELSAKDLLMYTEFLSPTTGYQAQLPVILAEYRFRTERDIEDYLSLISQVDEMCADIIAFEKEKSRAGLFMPDYAADAVIDQCEQFMEDPKNNYMIEVFNDEMEAFEGISDEKKEAYRQKNYELITTDVMNGYQILVDGLTELEGTGTNEKGLCYFEQGKAYYEYLARTGVGSDLTIAEMQKQTEDFIMGCIRNISVTLQARPEIVSELSDYKFPVSEPMEVLEDLNQKMLNDFPEPPEVNYTVKAVHPSMEKYSSPAFYLTTPIDDYSNNTIYINEAYLKKNTGRDIYTILAHEGYPGHLYQNAYTASCHLAPIRNLLSYPGYAEGWATYVENYAYGIGGLEKNLASVLAWNNEASLGMYAYADMGINYDGWEREELADYLDGFGITNQDAVDTIYEMMVEDPGNYLNYFIGYLEILNLRDAVKEKMGKKFVLKDFHKAFLEAGPAPFYLLEDYLLEE